MNLSRQAENYAVRSWQWPLGVCFCFVLLRAVGVIDFKVQPNEDSVRQNVSTLFYCGIVLLAFGVMGMGSAIYALFLLGRHPAISRGGIQRHAACGIATNVVMVLFAVILFVMLARLGSRV